jgi:hypothetical protein
MSETVDVFTIPCDKLIKYFNAHPELGFRFFHSLARLHAKKIYELLGDPLKMSRKRASNYTAVAGGRRRMLFPFTPESVIFS